MRPVDYLRREHELIAEFIEILSSINKIILSNQVIEKEDLKLCTRFIREFVDNIHHQKEETLFFPKLLEYDNSENTLSLLFNEHEMVRGLLFALEEIIKIPKQPLSDLSRQITDYISVMNEHMFKEEAGLFKVADKCLSALENQAIWERFETFENNVIGTKSIETYYTLIKQLKEKFN